VILLQNSWNIIQPHALCQQYTIYVTLYNVNGLNGFSLHGWDNVVANTCKEERSEHMQRGTIHIKFVRNAFIKCYHKNFTNNDSSVTMFVIFSVLLQMTRIKLFNLLKPTGHVMHQQFNTQQLYALPTLYLCVSYLSENKQRLVPLTA